MSFTGFTLTQVLMTAGAFAAAVVALYLLRLRRRRVTVPFIELWLRASSERASTRLFSKLRRILSLLIALLIVLALAVALGDPKPVEATGAGRTVVVLVDASASMQATDVVPSRFEHAVQQAQRLTRGLRDNDRMLIAQMGATLTPLSTLTSDSEVLEQAVRQLRPTDAEPDFEAALRFALNVLEGRQSPHVVLVTDGGLPEVPNLARRLKSQGVELQAVLVGEGGTNVAIEHFAVRRYPLDVTRAQALVGLWNPSSRKVSTTLTLLANERPIEVRESVLDPGERVQQVVEDLSGIGDRLEARLSVTGQTNDVLSVDDRAYAVLPPRSRTEVLLVTEGNLYLSAALLLDEMLQVREVTPAEYPGNEEYDVVIFDRFVPREPPPAPALYLHPSSPRGTWSPVDVVGRVEAPVFEKVAGDHPITRWLSLRHVNVAEALEIRPSRTDTVLAADPRAPLIVAGQSAAAPYVVLAFDVRQTDLPLRVAWPVLLVNVLQWFSQTTSDYVPSYPVGKAWTIAVSTDAKQGTLVDPGGNRHRVAIANNVVTFAGSVSGFYELQAGSSHRVFAANMQSQQESKLEAVQQLDIGGPPVEPGTFRAGVGGQPWWLYLVLGAALILALEWLTYHRRVTV